MEGQVDIALALLEIMAVRFHNSESKDLSWLMMCNRSLDQSGEMDQKQWGKFKDIVDRGNGYNQWSDFGSLRPSQANIYGRFLKLILNLYDDSKKFKFSEEEIKAEEFMRILMSLE